MGDMPFVTGLDSAVVWSNRALFHLDRRLGTPDEPDHEGQDWGLPVYDWHAMKADDYSWMRRRARRAGELYGLTRLDHAIGCYRLFWRGIDGRTTGFDPVEESDQLQLGERLMRMTSRFSEVIAEDLGAVPPYLRPSLERLGIAGMRVLRWEREGDGFSDPATWPEISAATNGTHDTDTTAAWYDALPPEERAKLRRIPALADLDPAAPFGPSVRDGILRAVYGAPSTLALIPFEDLWGGRARINDPAAPGAGNWTYRAAKTIDELGADEESTVRLAALAAETGRTPPR
jgi:4-alpha-glucanotransferase